MRRQRRARYEPDAADRFHDHLEVGLGTQVLIVGADLGLDVYELLDFFTGIVTIDPIGDDI